MEERGIFTSSKLNDYGVEEEGKRTNICAGDTRRNLLVKK